MHLVVCDLYLIEEVHIILNEEQTKEYKTADEPLKYLKPLYPGYFTWPYVAIEEEVN